MPKEHEQDAVTTSHREHFDMQQIPTVNCTGMFETRSPTMHFETIMYRTSKSLHTCSKHSRPFCSSSVGSKRDSKRVSQRCVGPQDKPAPPPGGDRARWVSRHSHWERQAFMWCQKLFSMPMQYRITRGIQWTFHGGDQLLQIAIANFTPI